MQQANVMLFMKYYTYGGKMALVMEIMGEHFWQVFTFLGFTLHQSLILGFTLMMVTGDAGDTCFCKLSRVGGQEGMLLDFSRPYA